MQVFCTVGPSSELLAQISEWSCRMVAGSLLNLAWVGPRREAVSSCFNLRFLNIASGKIKRERVRM